MYLLFTYAEAFRYVWDMMNFGKQKTGNDKGVQFCQDMCNDFEWDTCSTCDSVINDFSPETLCVLMDEFYMDYDNGRNEPQQWSDYRVNTRQLHKPLDRIRYQYTTEDMHQYMWSKHEITFKHGEFILPVSNVEAMLCYKWAEYAVCILVNMEHYRVPNRFQEEVLFELVYYKSCLSEQVLNRPIQDFDAYTDIYGQVEARAKSCGFVIPDHKELHDWPRIKSLSRFEKDVRLAIQSLCKQIRLMGLDIVIPFYVATPICGNAPASKVLLNAKFNTKRDDWPKDPFHNEIVKYLPGRNGFKSNPMRCLFSLSEQDNGTK